MGQWSRVAVAASRSRWWRVGRWLGVESDTELAGSWRAPLACGGGSVGTMAMAMAVGRSGGLVVPTRSRLNESGESGKRDASTRSVANLDVRNPPVRRGRVRQDGLVDVGVSLTTASVLNQRNVCERAVACQDARFDGYFITAVKTTGIYCRPSCPTPIRPKPANMDFYPSAAAARLAGFRACKRCRPDAVPGSPEWRSRTDLAARAVRLIADGEVERSGVGGLARRLAISERQLNRILQRELGAGALALARAQRAQMARVLLETTDMRLVDVAFASGFGSVRQFNDTMQSVFALAPSELRRVRSAAKPAASDGTTTLSLRIAVRPPYRAGDAMAFLAARAVTGLDEVVNGAYRFAIATDGGPAVVEARPTDGPNGTAAIDVVVHTPDVAAVGHIAATLRRVFDTDADPDSVDALLSPHNVAGWHCGLRVIGCPDPVEALVRAVCGQRVRLATGVGFVAEICRRCRPSGAGEAVPAPFPTPAEILAVLDDDQRAFGPQIPQLVRRPLRGVLAAVDSGDVDLGPGADRHATVRALQAVSGCGPWTAGYTLMRGMGDPDVWLTNDAVTKRIVGAASTPDRLRPFRSYAQVAIWRAGSAAPPTQHPDPPTTDKGPR